MQGWDFESCQAVVSRTFRDAQAPVPRPPGRRLPTCAYKLFFCIKYVARNNVSFGKPQASAQYGARIVGGTSSEPGEFPYLVALTVRVPLGAAFCGGTILDARRVLTAAHCMETAQSVTITAGAYNQAEDEPTQQTRYAK